MSSYDLNRNRSRSLALRPDGWETHATPRDRGLLFFVAILVFLMAHGFSLSLFSFDERYSFPAIAGVCLVVGAAGIGVLRVFPVAPHHYLGNFYLRGISIFLALALFLTFLNLVVINRLSPIEILRSAFMYGGFGIYVLFLSCRTDASFVTHLHKLIFAVTTATTTSLVLIAWCAPGLGDVLFTNHGVRFGYVRLALPGVLSAMAIYSLFYCLSMFTRDAMGISNRMLYAALFALYVLYFYTVDMGRRTMFVLPVTIAYYCFFHLNAGRKIQATFAFGFFLLLAFALPRFPVRDAIESAYASTRYEYAAEEGNVGVRVVGMRYYYDRFLESGCLGYGLTSTSPSQRNPFSWAREEAGYNPNDHGIFTVLFQFGFPAILLTIVMFWRIFWDASTIERRGLPEHRAIANAIRLYYCFSIFALLQVFWKPNLSFWTGMSLFMIWRMRDAIPNDVYRQQPAEITTWKRET